MSTGFILVAFVIVIVLMILAIAKFNVNAVTALLIAAIILGILIGTPLGDLEGILNSGFSGTIKSVAIIIFLGSLLGKILEETGAAQQITYWLLGIVGEKNATIAVGIAAFILGIPIFSDTVTILLIPIVSNIAVTTGISMMELGTALAVCAQITHCAVVPTPGPVAGAALLGVPFGTAILWGLVVSIPALICSLIWAKTMCKEKVLPQEQYLNKENKENLPPTGMALLPIWLPLALIVCANFIDAVMPDSAIANIMSFVGCPTAALITGCILAMILTGEKWKTKEVLNDWPAVAMKDAAMPLFVTGMGGCIAQLIKNADVATSLAEIIVGAGIPGLMLPIVLSVLIHVVTGSSTLAVSTTGALVAPMLETLGVSNTAAFLAVCAGAMMFKHGNSSAFWVGCSLSNMSFPQGLKGIGGGCTVGSIAMCVTTFILAAVGII